MGSWGDPNLILGEVGGVWQSAAEMLEDLLLVPHGPEICKSCPLSPTGKRARLFLTTHGSSSN